MSSPGGGPPTPEEERPGAELRTRPDRPRLKPQKRFPAWLVVPAAAVGGWFAAGWWGLVFGLVVGLFLWWSRR